MEKGKVTISIMAFFVTIMLVACMFVQFRTVEETNSIGIENMREDELRQEILNWKNKYNEIDEKLQSNYKKIDEYSNTIKNNQQSSELIEKELSEYNMFAGKTNVIGNGVVLKLSDNNIMSFSASSFIALVNELKYAGAEAISINNQRIVNSTDIVMINNKYILINGERIIGPYEVKAIGDKEKFEKILNYPNSGYVPSYKNGGYTISMEYQSDIRINAYDKEITLKYLEDKKEE